MMPTVPRYDVPTVSPQDIPEIRGYATAQAFGAGIGQAIAGVGSAIERSGDVLAANALRMQTLANQSEADELTFKWNIAQGELDSQQRALEGKARVDAFPAYVKNTTELREKFAAQASNQESKRLFHSETRRFAAYSIRNEAAGVGTAQRQANTKANENLSTMAKLSVQANPESQAVFDEALGVAQRAAKQESENLRDDPTTAELRQRAVESEMLTARIAALAGDKPIEASKLYEENKVKVLPQDRSKIESAINSGNQKIMGQGALVKHGIERAMKENEISMRTAGVPLPNAPTRQEIKATHGSVRATTYDDDMINAEIFYKNTKDLPIMTYEQMEQARRRLTPSPSSTQENIRFQEITKAYNDRLELRESDPALSVEDSAAVKDLVRKVDVSTPIGYKELITVRMSQQQLAGITTRSPGTWAEIRPLIMPLIAMPPGQVDEIVAGVKKNFVDKFGSYWKEALDYGIKTAVKSAPQREKIWELTTDPTLGPATRPRSGTPSTSAADTGRAAVRQRASTKAADSVIEIEPMPGATDEMGNPIVGPPTIVDKRSPSKYIRDTFAPRTK